MHTVKQIIEMIDNSVEGMNTTEAKDFLEDILSEVEARVGLIEDEETEEEES